jgi:Bacterial pre-peptidase C-terminal domain
MNRGRMFRACFELLPAFLTLVVGLAWAVPAVAQARANSSPEIVSDVPLVRVLAVSKPVHASKEGIQTQSPAAPMACPNGPVINPISCGATVSGSLTMDDCVFSDNSYYDLWGFTGTAGQQITITLSSSAFDTIALLYSSGGGSPIASDDDGGGGTNSLLVFTLPSSGTYYIGANSFDSNSFGSYTLTLQCGGGGGGGNCTPNSTTHCLLGGRYRVTIDFTPPAGAGGAAQALQPSVTSDTGLFWFFSANNIEVIIKVVSGCSFNSRIWVFSGGLTNVAYTITVTDTVTGISKTYSNTQGTPSQPIQDTNAFVCS